MIYLSPEQISTMRRIPTTRIQYVCVETSHLTPNSVKLTEWYSDGSHLQYEIDQAGGRVNG